MELDAVLLIAGVAGVGVLHTMVPDHWVPITLIGRQRGWTRAEVARFAAQAGLGHVGSTLLIGLLVWTAGVAFAARFGQWVDLAASLALLGFGGWIALAALRDLRRGGTVHSHAHGPDIAPSDPAPALHGPERRLIETDQGVAILSIFEDGVPPRFRLSGITPDWVRLQTTRPSGLTQEFTFARRARCWESIEPIPEPHDFTIALTLAQDGKTRRHDLQFEEPPGHGAHGHGPHGHEDGHLHDMPGHGHGSDPDGHGHRHRHDAGLEPLDALHLPLRGVVVAVRHAHPHRHGTGAPHLHWHDHDADGLHDIAADAAPDHSHRHRTSARTALLLILGSSPMVEGIPAFFAAGRYGPWLIAVMALVFAFSTIATYVLLCVWSTDRLQQVRLGRFERYGEVLSGAFIMLVGLGFGLWQLI